MPSPAIYIRNKMILKYRPINFLTDYNNVYEITKSSGFFEEQEINLALHYFNECKEKKENCEHEFLFADLEEKTIGYTNFGTASYSGFSYYLHWIAIHHDYRNLGLGKKLLLKTENIIKDRGAKNIFVETSSKDLYIPTQQFYLKCGYTVEAKLKKFYSETDDQIILSKKI
jgi:ribosomal protein S18 acetylase RimI-like enzyme